MNAHPDSATFAKANVQEIPIKERVSRPRTISNGPRPAGKNHKYHISSDQTRVHGLGPWDSNSLPRWKIPPDAMNCALIAVKWTPDLEPWIVEVKV